MPRTLTLRVKKICQKITNTTDINLTVIPIKKNGTTGVTIGYQFRSYEALEYWYNLKPDLFIRKPDMFRSVVFESRE
jgi:hypothetical protein